MTHSNKRKKHVDPNCSNYTNDSSEAGSDFADASEPPRYIDEETLKQKKVENIKRGFEKVKEILEDREVRINKYLIQIWNSMKTPKYHYDNGVSDEDGEEAFFDFLLILLKAFFRRIMN
jgi:hypothetical protein